MTNAQSDSDLTSSLALRFDVRSPTQFQGHIPFSSVPPTYPFSPPLPLSFVFIVVEHIGELSTTYSRTNCYHSLW